MVESIPKVNRKKNGKAESIYIWDYMYEQFKSRGIEAKDLLKSEPNYELIPQDLMNEAFQKWLIYDESHKNLDPEYSPKMFLFQHALQFLGFPNEHFNKRKNMFVPFKKSTLQKHFEEGRKLASKSNNQVSS